MALSLKDGLQGNVSTATKLANTRTLTVGNTGKNFDGSSNIFWSLSEIGAASSNHTHSVATTTTSGFMSNSDKTKLDGIQAGVKNTPIVNNLTSGGTTSALSAEQRKVLKGLVAKSFTPKTILSTNALSKAKVLTKEQVFDILNNISVIEYNGEKVITPKINSEYKIDENSNVPFITTEFMENGDIIVTNDINSMMVLLTESVKKLYEDNQYLTESLNDLKDELNIIKN